jgi:hypothetical protein
MTILDRPAVDPSAFVNDQMPPSVFAGLQDKIWNHSYRVELHVQHLVGGTPLNRDVVAGWIRSRVGTRELADLELAKLVNEAIEGREGTDPLDPTATIDAIDEVARGVNLNGFHRRNGVLVFPARCVKAAVKEAISVAIAGGAIGKDRGWGKTNKGILSWAAEHVYVPEEFLAVLDTDGNMLTEPTGIQQRQVSVHTGTSISREEYVRPAILRFEVRTDDDSIDAAWPTIWTYGQQQGIGSTRSQQFGRYSVTKFEKTTLGAKPKLATGRCAE